MDFKHISAHPVDRRSFLKGAAGGTFGLLAGGSLLAACGESGSATQGGPTQVIISNMPDKGTDKPGYAAWTSTAQAFMKKEPQYKIVGNTSGFDPSTFYALYAAGKAADCFQTFYTEIQGMIEKHIAYDIDAIFRKSAYANIFLPEHIAVVSGPDNHIYGLPYGVYGLGLMYNRKVFQQAGLDPDTAPATWDDFRAYAKRISDKTGKTGFTECATGNQGGWRFTNWLYSRGGLAEDVSSGKPKAVFNSQEGIDVLTFFHTMRWVDKSMQLQQANMQQEDTAKLVATGKAGMCIGGYPGDYYSGKGSIDFLSLAAMPQNGGNACLGGGNVWVVNNKNVKKNPAIAQGAVDYTGFTQYDLSYVETQIKAKAQANQPVGIPDVALFTGDYASKYQDIVNKYANVPTQNYKALATSTIAPKAEPKYSVQDMYHLLDTVVQAVFTKEVVDYGQLLDQAATTFQTRYLDTIQ